MLFQLHGWGNHVVRAWYAWYRWDGSCSWGPPSPGQRPHARRTCAWADRETPTPQHAVLP